MLAGEPIPSLIWKLSLPAMVGMLVNALYNFVDTIYIGHGVGALGIAGLSIAMPLQMIIGGIGIMLGVGAASVISRNLGARNYKRAELAFGNNLLAIVFFGAAIALLGIMMGDPILKVFGASDAILPYARDYMSIIFIGSPLIVFTMSMNNVIRSEGAAKVAMYSMIVGAVANIIMDPIFIFSLGMGVKGAAIATILSRVFSIVWIVYYYASGQSILNFNVKYIRPRPDIWAEIIVIGFPELVRNAATSFVFGMVNWQAATYGGDLAVALFGVNNKVVMTAGMPMIGIAQGMQPILGYSYGAGSYHRARDVVKRSAFIATVFSVCMAMCLQFFPTQVLSIFTNDAGLLSIGPRAMRLMTMGVFVIGFQMVGGSMFQAIGKALPSFVLNTSRQIFILIPFLYFLPQHIGLDGVWLSFPISDILSSVITLLMVLPQMKRFKKAELAMAGK